jgi:TolB-like protein/Tfp pilus assembly protein PilF
MSASVTKVSKGVFLSYASEDADAAKRICDALRLAGIDVWFDQSELRGGDVWDQKIRQQIRDCTLFIPVISANTQARPEGYFRLEWRLADQRTHLMGRRRTFLLPVCTDDTPNVNADVPDSFLATQWIRLSGGETPPAFAERVSGLLSIGERGTSPLDEPQSGAPAATIARTSALDTRAAQATPDKSIAVLPFVDMSEQKDQEYFADGMAEDILGVLLKVPGLKVIGRASSFQFKNRNEDRSAIGATLGALYVVEGSVRKAGEQIRVTAQLIDTRTGGHLWANSYDGAFGDILVLQRRIATSIARALQLTVDLDSARPVRPLRSAEAYSLYWQGRSLYDRKNEDSLLQAQSAFEQSIELDPSFARAFEALALTHIAQADYQSVMPAKALRRARDAAEKALMLDSNSATAHAVLGLVLCYHDFNWAAAEAEITSAVALSPHDPVILDLAAVVAHCCGQSEQAKGRISASLALDPLNPYAHTTLAKIQLGSGDDAGAERTYRKGLMISPEAAGNRYHLALILLGRGDVAAARYEFEMEYAVEAKSVGLAMIGDAPGARATSDAAISSLVRRQADLWPYGIAQLYAYRGEQVRALEWLEKAVALRDPDLLSYIAGDFLFDSLRTNARYQALRRDINLPE